MRQDLLLLHCDHIAVNTPYNLHAPYLTPQMKHTDSDHSTRPLQGCNWAEKQPQSHLVEQQVLGCYVHCLDATTFDAIGRSVAIGDSQIFEQQV